MREGARQYQDVIDLMTTIGYATTFTQTGGMNAALEVALDDGRTLLITDAEDSLSWERSEHRGWGVGLYPRPDDIDNGPLAFETSEDGSLEALPPVIESVLWLRD